MTTESKTLPMNETTVFVDLRGLTPQKEEPMSTELDPSTTDVKPGYKTTEGIIAIIVTLVTALTPLVAVLSEKFPNEPWVGVAVAAFALVTSLLVALGYLKKRSDVKVNANDVAGRLAEVKLLAELAPHLLSKSPSVPSTEK